MFIAETSWANNQTNISSTSDNRENEDQKNGDLKRVADNILLYQRSFGGWPKNYDRSKRLTPSEVKEIIKDQNKKDATIDNGATYKEIRLLALAYRNSQSDKYKRSAILGIHYLLNAQYKNGGWPQTYPNPKGYHRHITFNDNAMIGVMTLFQDIVDDRKLFSFVSQSTCDRCAKSIKKGIDCILRCQIIQNGKRTVWCAQHHAETFEPAKARSYELPSLSGSESVGIVRFLMRVKQPSPKVIQSVEAAIDWFEKSKIDGRKVVTRSVNNAPSGSDKFVVRDPKAAPLWGRFYDLKTNEPFFCSRDGIPKKTLAEISHERRNGYSWLGPYADSLLSKSYPQWKRRIQAKQR